MRVLLVLTALSVVGIAAACGGSDDGTVAPVDGVDSGEITADAGGDVVQTSPEAGSDASDTTPIVAPDDQWTWVDFPTSKCGSGTPTGIGVNPHAGATELLVYMQGGGSCTTGQTCWGASPSAANMAGFGAADFASSRQTSYPLLNRAIAANPLATTNMVFVPYCTGDLHGGRAEVDLTVNGATKPTYFYGGFDMELFLARLVPTFPNMKRVVLAGTSAGGFGTFLNFDKAVRAFGVRVDVIDDSGPPIPSATGMSQAAGGVWKIDLPQGCPQCVGLRDIYDADRLQQPNSRFGLLTFNRDGTIGPDFGYTVDQYPAVISAFTSSVAADKNAAVFEVDLTPPDAEHVVESQPALAPSYLPWMTKLLSDDATWANQTVTP